MNGYTPWELAKIKTRFHRLDIDHKGYIALEDIDRLCTGAARRSGGATTIPPIDARVLFRAMDVNRDGHVSFDDVVEFFGNTASDDDDGAALLRDYFFTTTDASAAAGASIGLLLLIKTKGAVALAAFFSDPIRLFRDYYVEYTAGIRSLGDSPHLGEAWRRIGALRALGSFLYAAALDASVGVVMFLVYAAVRSRMTDLYRRRTQSTPETGESRRSQRRLFISPSLHLLFEWTAGCTAGAVSGVLEIPAQSLAGGWTNAQNFAARMRHFGLKPHHRVLRASLSHGAFFSFFYASRSCIDAIVFDWLRIESTSYRSALTTAAAGCCAGAGYRLFAVPLENWSSYLRHRGITAWRAEPAKRKILFRGMGASLALTMPVTGLIFVGYEYALVTW